jgi:hypothetical protein
LWREVRFTAELNDAFRDAVGLLWFLGRVLKKLNLHRPGMNTLRHEIVPLIPRHAHDFRRQRLIEDLTRDIGVSAVGFGHRAMRHGLPRPLPKRFDVGEEWPGFLCVIVPAYEPCSDVRSTTKCDRADCPGDCQ